MFPADKPNYAPPRILETINPILDTESFIFHRITPLHVQTIVIPEYKGKTRLGFILGVDDERIIFESNQKPFEGTIINETIRNTIKEKSQTINIALVGNPNCGKTTFFKQFLAF
jgi:hypothetical protein